MLKLSNWHLTIEPSKIRSIQFKLIQQGVIVHDISDCKSIITVRASIETLQPLLTIEGVLEASYMKGKKQ